MAMDDQSPNILHPLLPQEPLPLPPPPPPPPPLHSSTSADASFPILAISIVGMLATAILLLSYYVFVIKCCFHSDLLRRLSRRSRHPTLRSPHPSEPGGLDESTIRSIPTLRFCNNTYSFRNCAVCLSEFREEEKLRMLPGCRHAFHVDCIDTWLQTHSTCPLCRAEITLHPLPPFPTLTDPHQPEPRRFKKTVGSMGDECIDLRVKDEDFFVQQPIRRSFSMDSSGDMQLYVAVQEILLQNPHFGGADESSSSGGGGTFGRNRKSFFSFGRASKSSAILPLRITDT